MQPPGTNLARLPLTIALLLLVIGCEVRSPVRKGAERKHMDAPKVDGKRALANTREVVELGPRLSNTPGAHKAASYLHERARKLGWNARIDEWTEDTDAGPMTFRNVRATLPGRGREFIMLGSHFDTKYLPDIDHFQGANDSGSSTGLLLALMEIWAQNPPDITLECVFFDGEESRVAYTGNDGLHGSKRVAARLVKEGRTDRCRAMILMDMIGDRELNVTFPTGATASLVRRAFRIAEAQQTRKYFGYFRGDILDDHVPFLRAGIPAINFIDFEFGPGNAYWHTGEDSMDKLSADSLEIVGNVVLALVDELAEKDGLR